MRLLVVDHLRKLQLIELDILKHFISICESHNLRYYAIGGTFLGVIRHKGFIPWDDDIDIGMPRSDYERFVLIAASELPEHLTATSAFTTPASYEYFTQIVDTRTTVKRNIANIVNHAHAWIDVFPLDGIPHTFFKKQWHLFWMLYLRMRIQFSRYNQAVHQYRINRPFHERLLMKFCEITHFGQRDDTCKLMEKFDVFVKRYDFDLCRLSINSMSIYKLRVLFSRKFYDDWISYQFEDIVLPGPRDYDAYLTQYYGNYMKLPDIDQAKKHHAIEITRL